MTMINATQLIERLRFFDGERLFASDLQGIDEFHRQMRQLHNASLHQPGIGNGFIVSGGKGDRQVTIGPGYAIDGKGQEIVHSSPLTLAVPPVAASPNLDGKTSLFYYLTVSYPTAAAMEQNVAETRAGVCVPTGTVALREEPLFCWIPLKKSDTGSYLADNPAVVADLKFARKLILARVKVLNCQIKSIDISQRKYARAMEQPRLACGKSRLQDLRSSKVALGAGSQQQKYIVFRATVTTSCGGFRTVPTYTARLDSKLQTNLSATQTPMERKRQKDLLLLRLSLVDVEAPAVDSFAVSMTIPHQMLGNFDPADANTPELIENASDRLMKFASEFMEVTWLGVET